LKKEGKNNKQILESQKKGELFFSFFVNTIKFFCLHYFFHHCLGNFLNTSLLFWKILDQIFFTHLTFKSTASFFIIKVRIWKDIWGGRGKEREIFFALNFQILKFWRTRSIHTSISKLASLFLHYFYMYLSSIKHLLESTVVLWQTHTFFVFEYRIFQFSLFTITILIGWGFLPKLTQSFIK